MPKTRHCAFWSSICSSHNNIKDAVARRSASGYPVPQIGLKEERRVLRYESDD